MFLLIFQMINSIMWSAGWGKSAFGHLGEYQSVLKKVDLPVIGHATCNSILKRTKLGPNYDLHGGFMCAGGERGKDSCEGNFSRL